MVGDQMLGKIVGINENIVYLKLNVKFEEMQSIINLYVLFEDGDNKLIGEIINIKDGIANVNLIGELVNNKFLFGISKNPSFGSISKLISKERINNIIGIIRR